MLTTNYENFHLLSSSFKGFSPWSRERIFKEIILRKDTSEIPGDFVFTGIFADPIGIKKSFIATSLISSFPYYYYRDKRGVFHGDNVFEVYGKANIPWEWDERSLYFINIFEHTFDDGSLHPKIKRFPGGAILFYSCDGEADLRFFDKKKLWEKAPFSLDQCVESFDSIICGYLTDKIAISLSAGCDSRLILAALLYHGIHPVVGTMGAPASTDGSIASKIAMDFHLEHRKVELFERDYWHHAGRIVELTSGSKTLQHWHTFIFALKADFPDGHVHWSGSNGEYARSYLDKGFVSLLLQGIDLNLFELYNFQKLKRRKRYLLNTLNSLTNENDAKTIISNCTSACNNTMDKFDEFYTFIRVRNFIGNGMELYNHVVPTLSPFLDYRFVQIANSLSRKYKLEDRFHRILISKYCPGLLKYPNYTEGDGMGSKKPPFYWLKKNKVIQYSSFDQVLSSSRFKQLICESNNLDFICTRKERQNLYKDRCFHTLSFLSMLHFVVDKIKSQDIRKKYQGKESLFLKY